MEKITHVNGIELSKLNAEYNVAGWRKDGDNTLYPFWSIVVHDEDNVFADRLNLSIGLKTDLSDFGGIRGLFDELVKEYPEEWITLSGHARNALSYSKERGIAVRKFAEFYLVEDAREMECARVFDGLVQADDEFGVLFT